MQLTRRFSLPLPTLDDYYDVERQYNAAMRILDANAVQGIGILTLRTITPEQLAKLEPDAQTLYAIVDADGFTLQLGALPMEGGGSAPTVSPFHPIAPYVTGAAGSFAYTETEEG